MSDPADLRQYARTDFLAAQHDADSLPGWVFKPVQFSQGPAGLVLNMSDGGLQVLTSAAEPLTDDRYEVVLLLGRSGRAVPGRPQRCAGIRPMGALRAAQSEQVRAVAGCAP